MLGVVFTIPLRRALVTNSDLPYPEGVAAAEVLKVGSGTRGETKDDTGEAREGPVDVAVREHFVKLSVLQGSNSQQPLQQFARRRP